MKILRFALPLTIFIAMIGFLYTGLLHNTKRNPDIIPSALINKPAPAFKLPPLPEDSSKALVSAEQFIGEVWLLNVFASWCEACVHEHPVLLALDRQSSIKLIGLNYKDTPHDASVWLQRLGNPYDAIAQDISGITGIDYGVYGVPESFVIDKKGIIRYKHIGPISIDDANNIILPLLNQLTSEDS